VQRGRQPPCIRKANRIARRARPRHPTPIPKPRSAVTVRFVAMAIIVEAAKAKAGGGKLFHNYVPRVDALEMRHNLIFCFVALGAIATL